MGTRRAPSSESQTERRWGLRTTEHALGHRAKRFLSTFPSGCPPLPSHPGVWVPHSGAWVLRQGSPSLRTIPSLSCQLGSSSPSVLTGTFRWTHRHPTRLLLVSAQSCCSSRAVGWALWAEARGTQLLWYAAFLPLTGPCWQAESRVPQGSAMPEPDSEAAVGLTGEGPTHLPPSRSSSGELLSPDL